MTCSSGERPDPEVQALSRAAIARWIADVRTRAQQVVSWLEPLKSASRILLLRSRGRPKLLNLSLPVSREDDQG
jgi:hypothetical protein